MNFSLEQQAVISAASNGKNILCNAVAGAGKTTTLIGIAKSIPSKSIIQITYNRKLKQEVRKKVKDCDVNNMDVVNYHSLCLKYYGNHTDNGIIDVGKGILTPILHLSSKYDTCIIDETQDMTPEFYDFVRVFVTTHCKENFQLIVMGDEMQSVYDFKMASPSYLTAANRYWPEKEFVRLSMSTSFRIPPEVAQCVNELAGRQIITSAKSSSNILVTLCTIHTSGCHPELKTIVDDISEGNIRANELMVILPGAECGLATSFINRLVKRGIPIYKQSDAEESSNEKYSKGKVLVCTYHTSKGLERDTVICFNFDLSYYTIYQPDKSVDALSSTLYVGMTRALRRLYLVENGERFSFVTPKALSYMNVPASKGNLRYFSPYIKEVVTVPRILKFLPSQLLYQLTKEIENSFEVVDEIGKVIEIPKDLACEYKKKEYVADLTITAMKDIFETKRTGTNRTARYLEFFDSSTHIRREYLDSIIADLEDMGDKTSTASYLRMAVLAEMCRTGHTYRFRQITNYDWVGNGKIGMFCERMEKFPDGSSVRSSFGREIMTNEGRKGIIEDVDVFNIEGEEQFATLLAFSNHPICDIKKLSLIFVAWIMAGFRADWQEIKYEIYNVITEERLKLNVDINSIERVCNTILSSKFTIP